jgi:hypothetical protein
MKRLVVFLTLVCALATRSFLRQARPRRTACRRPLATPTWPRATLRLPADTKQPSHTQAESWVRRAVGRS